MTNAAANDADKPGPSGARRRWLIGAAVAAALVLAAAVVALISLPGRHSNASAGSSATPSPSVAATPTATGEAASASACGSGEVTPAGGIARADLCDGTIPVPAWSNPSCPSGPVTVKDGQHFIAGSFFLNVIARNLASDGGLAYVDTDHDGDVETIVILSCGGETWISQVVALDRAADGTLRLVGPVTRTEGNVKRIYGVTAGPNGSVVVDVGDIGGSLGDDGSRAQHQSRTFGWTGHAFKQTGGPTSFPANPRLADLALTAGPLAFGPATAGTRTGTLTLTVKNRGPSAVPYSVAATLPSYAHLVPAAGCTVETFPQPVITVTCTRPQLASGATATLTLTFRAPADGHATEMVPEARVAVSDTYTDPGDANNTVDVAITFA